MAVMLERALGGRMGKSEGDRPKKRVRKTTLRLTDEMLAQIQEQADKRGRSVNVTIVDLIEGGFDWFRERYRLVK